MRFLPTPLRLFSASFKPRAASIYRHSFTKPRLPISSKSLLKAAPTIPILGSFFSTSAKAESPKMSYPDQRNEAEWRAVLSPGTASIPILTAPNKLTCLTRRAIPRPPRKRHRTTLHRRIRHPQPDKGHLHLHRLQRTLI